MTTTTQPAALRDAERRKWDGLAAGRTDASLRVRDANFAAYCARVATMEGIAEFLGDLRGERVLELGCGLGELTTLLALSGAHVTAVDLSSGSIAVARRRARLHGVEHRCRFVVGPAESLPFAGATFDVVFGKAVLHHLDAALGAPELERVLRPGGRAAFSEPLGTNVALAWARNHVPYPNKNPVGGDTPLTGEALRAWRAPFADTRQREIQLLSMIGRALGRPAPRLLRRVDRVLLGRFPALRRHCRYVVLTLRKAQPAQEPAVTGSRRRSRFENRGPSA